jgi:phage major head subunit gpT-like protein
MEFSTWLEAKGFDAASLSKEQKATLQAAWRAEQAPPAPAPEPAPADDRPKPESAGFDAQMAAIEAENERIKTIQDMGVKAAGNYVGDANKTRDLRKLTEAAVSDKTTSVKDFQLALLRFDRVTGPMILPGSSREQQVTAEVLEAAVCKTARLPGVEKEYDDRTLAAADKHFRNGIGIHALFDTCARANGWRGSHSRGDLNNKDFLRTAFYGGGMSPMAGDAVPSTYSLPNIFANVANKFLRAGFDNVDSAWRQITAIRSTNDFKTTTTISLNGATTFRKVAPGGEIKHGTLTELAYTNRAETYGIMLGIDRRDMVNDDLGALSRAGQIMGRGAAKKINDVFYSVFLNNSSFFTSGNNNVSTGAGSALSSAGLKAADQKFRVQTDQEGLPLGAMPKILFVPPTLWYTARELMNATANVGNTTANTLLPNANIWQGAYTVVTSPYLENSAYTGNSAAAWYLLSDPNDIPVIETIFLNGRDTPIVETAELDFDLLGVAMRGYLDFGVSLQEFRGGVT